MDDNLNMYGLTAKQKERVGEILNERDLVYTYQLIKDKIQESCDAALEQVRDYIYDEYVLQFDEVVEERCNQIISSILRGEEKVAEFYGFIPKTDYRGDLVAYDRNKVRAKIVEDFSDKIKDAHVLNLEQELEETKEQLRWARERCR